MEEIFARLAKNYNVSRETFLQLSDYVAILLKWQSRINLISSNTAPDIWHRHIEDSLQLLPHVPRETSLIIDIGSGSGMPGIPLAITTKLTTFLIESDQRKCIFLEEAARITKSDNIKVLQKRAENAKMTLPATTGILISARAVAETTDLFSIISTLIINNNISDYKILLPKGKTASNELDIAKAEWDFEFSSHKSITDEAASILVIQNLRRKA